MSAPGTQTENTLFESHFVVALILGLAIVVRTLPSGEEQSTTGKAATPASATSELVQERDRGSSPQVQADSPCHEVAYPAGETLRQGVRTMHELR